LVIHREESYSITLSGLDALKGDMGRLILRSLRNWRKASKMTPLKFHEIKDRSR
jgi:hypothetical protein